MKYFVFVVILSGYINFAQAANLGNVVINEIAWMGTQSSHSDEWIELRNNTDSPINLAGWTLRSADGSPSAKLTKNDIVKDFYLLKRGKNYTGALENSGEILELYDNLDNLVDRVDASSGWPAGDNASKQTMEKTGLGWQTSQNRGGTPMAENIFENPKIRESGQSAIRSFGRKAEPSKSFYAFLTASAAAIFSGGIILFLKKKLV